MGLRSITPDMLKKAGEIWAQKGAYLGARRQEFITQVYNTIFDNLGTESSGCLRAKRTEAQARVNAKRIAQPFVDAFLSKAYGGPSLEGSRQSFGWTLWVYRHYTDAPDVEEDPWNQLSQNVHAGWLCYQWLMNTLKPVQNAAVRGNTCFLAKGVGNVSGGTVTHRWIAILGCQADQNGNAGTSFQSEIGFLLQPPDKEIDSCISEANKTPLLAQYPPAWGDDKAAYDLHRVGAHEMLVRSMNSPKKPGVAARAYYILTGGQEVKLFPEEVVLLY
jgi:hypothetical protein